MTSPAVITSPGTRNWAITTLVLTVIYLLLVGVGLYQLPDSPINATGKGTLLAALTIVQFTIAIAFLDGSIGVLKNKAWARWTLAGAAAIALPVIALGVTLQAMVRNNPAFLTAVTDKVTAKAPQMAAMPPETLHQAITMQMSIAFFSTIFLAIFQAVYCILLYRHMAFGDRTAER